jgi:hypothetical protein
VQHVPTLWGLRSDWGMESGPRSQGKSRSHPATAGFRFSWNGKLVRMQGGRLIRHSRLMAVGIALCLLSALFAVEAKVAWYSPAGSATARISSAKLLPTEAPKLFPQRFASPFSPSHDSAENAALVAFARVSVTTTILAARTASSRPPVSASPSFSPSLFFRPPPVV